MPLPDDVYVCGLLLEDVVPDVVVVADELVEFLCIEHLELALFTSL